MNKLADYYKEHSDTSRISKTFADRFGNTPINIPHFKWGIAVDPFRGTLLGA